MTRQASGNTITEQIYNESVNPDRAVASVIRALPDRVANQIAAGEVVERPASIVKELVENSLDAGSAFVNVSIGNGGKSLIEVTDDGSGMCRDDALLAFERHATSKIKDENDLKAIRSFGFRGEALGSIASVSRLTLSTCLAGEEAGAEVVIEGGVLKNVKDSAPIKGVKISVGSLFFNIPARRKFLRSEKVEASHCQEAVIRQAIGRPDARFRLIRDGRQAFDTRAIPEKEGLMGRIKDLFGEDLAKELAPVDFLYGAMRLTGFISRPGTSRGARDTQYIYINGRYVKDRLINLAIAEGYRSLIPKGRHPALFLYLSIPPERVDVNVSPTKMEVRFVDGRAVIELVRSGLYDSLKSSRDIKKDFYPPVGVSFRPLDEVAASGAPAPGPQQVSLAQPEAILEPAPPAAPVVDDKSFETITSLPLGRGAQLFHFDFALPDNFAVVGQVFKTFIVVEGADRLLLFDQHTLDERVNYEKLVLALNDGRVDTQELLFPVQLELSRVNSEFMARNLENLQQLGFVVEAFGESSFNLRAVPALLLNTDYKSAVIDILDTVVDDEIDTDFSIVAESAINIIACRGAVKAGQSLNKEEARSLLSKLARCA
ncbi:DNA mismatch repair protein MutL, partial [hydrothermal vent metagenome]